MQYKKIESVDNRKVLEKTLEKFKGKEIIELKEKIKELKKHGKS